MNLEYFAGKIPIYNFNSAKMKNLFENCLKPPKLYYWLITLGICIPIATSLFWRILNPADSSIVDSIKFKETIQINSVAQVLTMLFLIATFLERALEVYMITFRKPGENAYENDPKGLDEYKHETSKIALWSALTIGIVISVTGIRGIEPFIVDLSQTAPETTTQKLTNWQIYWFRVSDILLTGGVIAGGSDFIHKILQIFTTFMDATAMTQKSTEAKSKVEVANANKDAAEANLAAVEASIAAKNAQP